MIFDKIKKIEVEVFSKCNRRCNWCPNVALDRLKENFHMDEETYLRLLHNLKDNGFKGEISFSRYNEPTANHKVLQKRVRQAKEILPNNYMLCNTNGDYLRRKGDEILDGLMLDELNIMDYDCRGIEHGKELFKKCNNDYIVNNLIKYAILKKYGGLWLPKDTIMLNDIFSANDISIGNIVTYGKNNTNLYDNLEYSDLIIGAPSNNQTINDIVKFITLNLNTFQNGILFKNSINKFFNTAIRNSKNHVHKNLLITEISNNQALSISHLFSTSFINIKDFSKKTFININADNINNSVKYSYLFNMSPEQILESNLFISYLIQMALQ